MIMFGLRRRVKVIEDALDLRLGGPMFALKLSDRLEYTTKRLEKGIESLDDRVTVLECGAIEGGHNYKFDHVDGDDCYVFVCEHCGDEQWFIADTLTTKQKSALKALGIEVKE